MIDKNKQYRTRDGREVRIYATDGGGEFCVHGAILFPNGRWEARQWPINGKIGDAILGDAELIEVRPRIKREVWVNVYPEGHFNCGAVVGYTTKHDADHSAIRRERIACVKLVIDCEEGEGL